MKKQHHGFNVFDSVEAQSTDLGFCVPKHSGQLGDSTTHPAQTSP